MLLQEIKQQVDQLKDQIQRIEISNQNKFLAEQLKLKLDQLQKKLDDHLESQFNNILAPNPKVLLPQVRQRAISTSEQSTSDNSFIAFKPMRLKTRQTVQRYHILNEYEDPRPNAKLDSSFKMTRYQSVKKEVQMKTQNLLDLQPVAKMERSSKQWMNPEHQYKFLIKDGCRINCFELISFQAQYKEEWLFINAIIKRLEELSLRSQMMFVDGKRIVQLIKRGRVITLSDLLKCLCNSVDIRKYFEDKLYSPGRAATKIQSSMRGFLQKNRFKEILKNARQIALIQKRWRIYTFKQQTRKTINEKSNKIYEEFKVRQTQITDFELEIHISSCSEVEYTRLTMEKFLQRENQQLSRIFRAQNIAVIYVSAIPIDKEIMRYLQKIFELREQQFRVKFLTVESNGLPAHMSLLNKLLYSSSALKTLKGWIGNQRACIIPGQLSTEFIKLSHELQIPIYSGLPQLHQLYSTKSGSQVIFSAAELPTAPGAQEIYDEIEMINTLTVLIVKNPNITKWVFKIDSSFQGRGIATLNIDAIPGIQDLLKMQADEEVIQVAKKIIKNHLPNKLKIAVKRLYRTYQEYIQAFLSSGGVIEAYPCQIQSMNISFEITHKQEVKLLTTYDSHQGQPFVHVLHTYPSQVNIIDANKVIDQLSKVFNQLKMIGYFTINLLHFKGQFWANGLDCFLNPQTSIISYYQMLSSPKFHAYCPFIFHPGLYKVLLKNFFHVCRLDQVSYDFNGEKGQSFVFPDILQSGVLQLISIADSHQECLQFLDTAFRMMIRIAGNLNVTYGESIYESRNDLITFLDVLGAIRMQIKQK